MIIKIIKIIIKNKELVYFNIIMNNNVYYSARSKGLYKHGSNYKISIIKNNQKQIVLASEMSKEDNEKYWKRFKLKKAQKRNNNHY